VNNLGNQPPLPAIFPDQLAPVVRLDGNGERTLDWLRGVSRHREARQSSHNERQEHRESLLARMAQAWFPLPSCLPRQFCEHTDTSPKVPHWFALGDTRPLFAFAVSGALGRESGNGKRRASAVRVPDHRKLTKSCADHAKAMPVILTGEAWDVWLEGETEKALELVRPFPRAASRSLRRGSERTASPSSASNSCAAATYPLQSTHRYHASCSGRI